MSEIEVLLVEDGVEDRELTVRALRQSRLANRIHEARDGVEALDFLFARGAYAGRDTKAVSDAGAYWLLLNQAPR
jgi:two-component system response regulator